MATLPSGRNTFDAVGQLTNLVYTNSTPSTVRSFAWTYDAAGRAETITRYANLAATQEVITGSYTFDAVGQLTNLVYTNSTPSTVRSFAWTYDAAGRIVAHDSDIAAEDVSDYSYDDTNQLTEADYTTGTDESYVYDDNGNRVTAGGSSYETGPNNQLISDGTYRYEYDANGNLIYRYVDADASESLNAGDTDITEYEWDNRNRLTDVVHRNLFGGSTDWTAEYIYDCLNRRIGSLYDDDGNTSIDREERYVWEGKNAVLDFVDADGDGGAYSDELTTRYLWCTAVDKLLAQETVDNGGAEDVRWSVLDNLGSIRSLVNYTGAVTSTYSYDSFGNVTALVGSLSDSRYLYTGQEYDLHTGDYYYDARWYDPAVGTFISEDPIGILGNPIGPKVRNSSCCSCGATSTTVADINLYRYCKNNPLIYTDPKGLCKESNDLTYSHVVNSPAIYACPSLLADWWLPGSNICPPEYYPPGLPQPPKRKPNPQQIWGNWCGSDWTGGQAGTWNEIDQATALPPIDCLDTGCMHHDKCYGHCRDTNPRGSQARADCFKKCDRELAVEAAICDLGPGPHSGWELIFVFLFTHTNPSTDDI